MYRGAVGCKELQGSSPGFQCPLQNRLALERYRRSKPHRSIEELRREALQLAELALVAETAAIQWLLQLVMDGEKRQGLPVEGRHLALAGELSAEDRSDQQSDG